VDIKVKLHSVAEDGLPDMDRLIGRVALIFDGCVVSGWPTGQGGGGAQLWEADTDVGHNRFLRGVTHWLEFPVPVWKLHLSPTPSKVDPGGQDGHHAT
jgi:hypothetical protein